MCGIAGIFDVAGSPVDAATVRAMTAVLVHRGPDGAGEHVAGHVGLGHRRLAIIDLSDAAAQPMTDEDGSVRLVFNGEIYNFRELRRELEGLGHRFASQSDTEVIVHGYQEWGGAVVDRLNGMFAFALYDPDVDALLLARDRYGTKPLYYAFSGDRFVFASEVKGLLEAGAWTREVDPQALVEYFTFQNVLSDRTLFAGVRLLPAGHRGWVRRGSRRVETERFWDFAFESREDARPGGFEGARDGLRELLREAVVRQLVSDVPVGSYLSGGMDSGTLVAFASSEIPHLMTFTGGFDLTLALAIEQNFDEREAAEAMASLFRSDHYETVLHPGSMARVLPRLVWHLEDLRVGMCYQNWYIAGLAAKFVKVVLSGGGGDEIFAGYPWRYAPLMRTASVAEFEAQAYRSWQRLVPEEEMPEFLTDEARAAVGEYSTFDVFRGVFAGRDGDERPWSPVEALDREMYFEAKTFLHGLLVVEDKISGAHSLEARVPFLDNELVDYVCGLPAGYRLDVAGLTGAAVGRPAGAPLLSSDGKYVLREAMKGLLPDTVLRKRKQGFSTPDGSWYRGDSMPYIREVLLSERSLSRGWFQPERVRRVVEEHDGGVANHRLLLWSLLCFEWWNRIFVDRETGLF